MYITKLPKKVANTAFVRIDFPAKSDEFENMVVWAYLKSVVDQFNYTFMRGRHCGFSYGGQRNNLLLGYIKVMGSPNANHVLMSMDTTKVMTVVKAFFKLLNKDPMGKYNKEIEKLVDNKGEYAVFGHAATRKFDLFIGVADKKSNKTRFNKLNVGLDPVNSNPKIDKQTVTNLYNGGVESVGDKLTFKGDPMKCVMKIISQEQGRHQINATIANDGMTFYDNKDIAVDKAVVDKWTTMFNKGSAILGELKYPHMETSVLVGWLKE